MDNPFDRCLDKWCRVEWEDNLYTRQEQRLQGGHFFFDQSGGVQGVCPGRQGDGHTCSRFAVEARGHVVVLHAEFDAGNIPEANLRAVGIDLQHDLFEIPDAFQARLCCNGGVQLLARNRRCSSQLACGDIGILCHDSSLYLGGGEVEARHAVGIKPDTHRIGLPEHLNVTDTGNAAQRIEELRVDKIVHRIFIDPAVVRIDAHDHQEPGISLGDPDALLLDLLGQVRHDRLQLVLHLHLGDIGVGFGFEGHRDADVAVRIAPGAEVAEMVDTGESLFDDLRHAVFNCFGRCAGIGGVDVDGRRRDARILLDRQSIDGDNSAEHDADGDHPGKDGSLYKKSGHNWCV